MGSMPLTLRALTGHVVRRALLLLRVRQFFRQGHQPLAQRLGVLHLGSPPLSVLLQTAEQRSLTPGHARERACMTQQTRMLYFSRRRPPTACFPLAR